MLLQRSGHAPESGTTEMSRIIVVTDYDAAWPLQYQAEAERLRPLFGSAVVAMHHIGSTSVPGLRAKPTIDILVEVAPGVSIEGLYPAMSGLGYDCRGECLDAAMPGTPGRHYFSRRTGAAHTHHVHVCHVGHHEVSDYLALRDYLRAHPDEAARYAELKTELTQRFSRDNLGYMRGKDQFVKELIHSARQWRGPATGSLPDPAMEPPRGQSVSRMEVLKNVLTVEFSKLDAPPFDPDSEEVFETLLERLVEFDVGPRNSPSHLYAALADPDLLWHRSELSPELLIRGPGDNELEMRLAVQAEGFLHRFIKLAEAFSDDASLKPYFRDSEIRFPTVVCVLVDYADAVPWMPPPVKDHGQVYRVLDGYHRAFQMIRNGRAAIPAFTACRRDGSAWKGNFRHLHKCEDGRWVPRG